MNGDKNIQSSNPASEHPGRHNQEKALNVECLVVDECWTTIMIRNIPCRFKKEAILQDVDSFGFEGCYDYFYLPQDRRRKSNLGYAFLNFKDSEHAVRFAEKFRGHRFNSRSEKTADVTVASIQGFQNNLAHLHTTGIGKGDLHLHCWMENSKNDWENEEEDAVNRGENQLEALQQQATNTHKLIIEKQKEAILNDLNQIAFGTEAAVSL